MTRRIALAGAVALSIIGVGMAAAAAIERGASTVDRVLIVACAVAITLAAHLLPALTRRAAGWALWAACVALTVYGHTMFFAAAGQRAGEHRALSVAPSEQSAALLEQLRSTAARAPSAVAADLAAVRSRGAGAALQLTRCEREQPGRCAARRLVLQQAEQQAQALQIEADEAHRAAGLRAELTAAAAQLDTRRSAAADGLGGLGADGVLLAMSVLSAVVVELLAALLWAEVLSPKVGRAEATVEPPARAARTSMPARTSASIGDPSPPAADHAPRPHSRWPPWLRTHLPARPTTPTSTRSH